jgi:hypothetical protein
MPSECEGEWGPGADGGCPKNASWHSNPFFLVTGINAAQTITLSLTTSGLGDSPAGMQLLLVDGSQPLPAIPTARQTVAKSRYNTDEEQSIRVQVSAAAASSVYIVHPATLDAGAHGSFTLSVVADDDGDQDIGLEPWTPPEGAGAGDEAAAPPATPAAAAGGGEAEGLQTEPEYPSLGFLVCRGRGNHVLIDKLEPSEVLFKCASRSTYDLGEVYL